MAESSLSKGQGFGYKEIADALWPQVEAMEDAQGCLVAAAEELRLPRQRSQRAHETLTARRRELACAFRELGLIGESINFESGVSRATTRATRLGDMFLNPTAKAKDLAGVAGTVLDVEAGTILGMPIEPSEALVMHVGVKGGLRPLRLPHNYVVLANEAVYTIGELPPASQNGHR